MVFDSLKIIFASLSSGFDVAIEVFDSVGISWLAAVCLMVLVAAVLRLFTAQFIGSAISVEVSNHKEQTAKFKRRRRKEAMEKESSKKNGDTKLSRKKLAGHGIDKKSKF